MKLKNKKTGEIKEFNNFYELEKPSGAQRVYCSIAELNEEWEDYEEPKEYWYIEPDSSIIQNHKPTYINHLLDGLKSIGNYFETKEEAEQAVRKLKAWKRLKDEYDFKFTGWKRDEQYRGDFIITAQDWNTSDDKLLDLLFGGEE